VEFLLNQGFLKDAQTAFPERFKTVGDVLSAAMSERESVSSASPICVWIVGWLQVNLNQLTLNELLEMDDKLRRARNLLAHQPTDLWDSWSNFKDNWKSSKSFESDIQPLFSRKLQRL
jgi:hypothetical protein